MHESKRLAITISGAVSLGSYEAGVLYEVFTALAQHNRDPKTAAADRIFVDVLTGASAGGMTAAIAGQMLAGNTARAWSVDDNPFYNAWVKQVDLAGLLRLRPGEDPLDSLLSSDCVQEIADRMIPSQWAPGDPHPVAASELRLGLALTNLDGFDCPVATLNGAPFVYTCYQDQLRRDLRRTDAAGWKQIGAAALACGAFPVAFRVRELLRTAEFSPGVAATLGRPFAYTDGGVFDNQPLGMARDLAGEIDEPWDNDRRFYLFVSPWPKASSVATNPLRAAEADFEKTLEALVSAVFNQARYRDWVQAEGTNRGLTVLNERAEQLAQLLLGAPEHAATLGPAAAWLAGALVADKTARFTRAAARPAPAVIKEAPRVPGSLDQERARLRRVFAQLGRPPVDYHPLLLAKSPGAAAAWIDTLLVLEYAAQLEDKAEMNIALVTARDDELASAALSAFAGFFDEEYRQHDYEVGRKKARDWLETLSSPASGGGASLGPLNYVPATGSAPNPRPELNGLPLGRTSPQPRRLLRAAIVRRADGLVAKHVTIFGVSWVLRWLARLVAWFVVSKQLGLGYGFWSSASTSKEVGASKSARWGKLQAKVKRLRASLIFAAVVIGLDLAGFGIVWHYVGATGTAGSSIKAVLEIFGPLSTALSAVVGVFYFFWRQDQERRSQAVKLVADAAGALRELPADLVFLANNLDQEQATACMNGASFELTGAQQPAFEDILGADIYETATKRLRRKHSLALQGIALGYLNILESTLISRDQGLADAEMLAQQFGGFYDPTERRFFLANFVDASRSAAGVKDLNVIADDDPYAVLARFERELRQKGARGS